MSESYLGTYQKGPIINHRLSMNDHHFHPDLEAHVDSPGGHAPWSEEVKHA